MDSSHVLTCLSICAFQFVGAPCLFAFCILTLSFLCIKAITLQVKLILCQGTIVILQVYLGFINILAATSFDV
jgi:hypothetical protein